MDLKEASDLTGFWTNEKHVNFLNSMEASFVRTMLQNDGRSLLMYAASLRPPLDRHLPDSSESTRDLEGRRSTRKRAYFHDSDMKNDIRTKEKTRKISSQPSDASEDQVVPQLGKIKRDKGENREPEVAIASGNEDTRGGRTRSAVGE